MSRTWSALGISALIAVWPCSAGAETLGARLVDRSENNTLFGQVYILTDGEFTRPGVVTSWSFFDNDSAGGQVTPIIVRKTGRGEYEVVGVGATRTSDGSGLQTFDFELAAGCDVVERGYTVGFKDGPRRGARANRGVIDMDREQGRFRFTPPSAGSHHDVSPGARFGGVDIPLQGPEATYSVAFTSEPSLLMEVGGVIAHRETLVREVVGGRIKARIALAKAPDGPASATLALMVTTPVGEDLTGVKATALSPTPAGVEVEVPARVKGDYQVEVLVQAEDGKVLHQFPRVLMRVPEWVRTVPGRTPYTSESEGHLVVNVAGDLMGRELFFEATLQDRMLAYTREIVPGGRIVLPFPLSDLAEGEHEIKCRLLEAGETLQQTSTRLVKLPPRPNEVKIDRVSRGLLVDDLPFIPFGFYCGLPQGATATLPQEEALHGFTLISPYQGAEAEMMKARLAYLDRCAQVGLKVNYHIYGSAPPSETKWETIRREVEAVKDHPALLSYYLADEPEGQGVSPEVLREAYQFVRKLDPYHPVTVVYTLAAESVDYQGCQDIVMTDHYFIPFEPLRRAGDRVAYIDRVFDRQSPVWNVPQAFGGGEGWPREPTAREQRVMTYLTFIKGGTGVQYFIRVPPNIRPLSPSLWSECRRLALEIAELTPALLSREPRPKVTSSGSEIHAAAWRDRGAIVILAANAENQPQRVKLELQEVRYSGPAEVLFEGRQIEVKRGTMEDLIDAYGTRAYRLQVEPPSPDDLEVHPKNLTYNPSFELWANAGTPDGCYANAGTDPGSTLFLDARVARHGSHSLRLTTPTEGAGLTVVPFPTQVRQGASYRLSVWAKGSQPGQVFEMSVDGIGKNRFALSLEWKEYGLSGVAQRDASGDLIRLQLISPGQAWFDLLQLVPMG